MNRKEIKKKKKTIHKKFICLTISIIHEYYFDEMIKEIARHMEK